MIAAPRIKGLDGLRAIAALWVCLFHLNEVLPWDDQAYRQFAKLGHLGVPVFFVISGLVVSLSAEHGDWRRFARARLLRIYPPYLTSLLITLAVIVGTRLVTGVNDLGPWPAQTSVWFAMFTLTTWPISNVQPLNWVYWSLSLEVLFYIAMLIPLLWRNLRLALPLALSAACLGLSLAGWQHPLLSGWPTFACGIALAWALTGRAITALALLSQSALMLAVLDETAQFVTTIIVTALIATLALRSSVVFSALLDWKPLAAMGRWSYSIYLLHVPLGVWLVARLRPDSLLQHPIWHPLMDILCIAWVVALSALHYRWVERVWIDRSRGGPILLSAATRS